MGRIVNAPLGPVVRSLRYVSRHGRRRSLSEDTHNSKAHPGGSDSTQEDSTKPGWLIETTLPVTVSAPGTAVEDGGPKNERATGDQQNDEL